MEQEARTFTVNIELNETSQTITIKATNTYQKGDLFCVMDANRTVQKFPLANIWRITEHHE